MRTINTARFLGATAVSLGLFGPWAVKNLASSAPSVEGFGKVSFIEIVPVDGERQLGLSAYLSPTLIDDSSKEIVRQVVFTETFETKDEARILSRSCMSKAVNPAGDESIETRISVPHVLSGTEGEVPIFRIEITPKLGKKWQDIMGFDDLLVAVSQEPR